AVAAAPTNIAAVSGDAQVGRVTQPLAAPLVVKVTDDNGNPVSGATVTWTANNGTIGASTTTDASGNSSNTLTLGTKAGAASATASIGAKSVTFGATVQPGIVAQIQ